MQHFHKLALASLSLFLSYSAHAQVGVGGATPTAARTGTMLDVNGAIATYETTIAATGTTSPTAAITGNVGQVQLTTGTATAGPITVSYAGTTNSGQRLVIYNNAAYAATLNNQNIPAVQAVEFVYSNGGWRANGDGSNSLTATNGLTKTGNAIGLGGTLTQATTIGASNFPLSVTGLNNTSATFGTGGGIVLGSTLSSTGSTGIQRLEFASNGDPNAVIGHTTRAEGSSTEINDLYLYSGDNIDNTYGPDRIRVVAPNILFQSLNATGGVNTLANAETNTSTTTNMFIGSAGSIGIGTITPTQTLDVNGTARVRTLATGAAADQLVTAGADGTLNQRTAASVVADGGAVTTATNGLTKTGSAIGLGGTLTGATTINMGSNALNYSGAVNSGSYSYFGNTNGGGSAYTALNLNNDATPNGDTNALVLLQNSANRFFDGGPNAATLRNNAGALNLQSTGGGGITLPTDGTTQLNNVPSNGGTNMLAVDNNGVVRKQALPTASAPVIFGTFTSTGIDITASSSTYVYTGSYITIPAGSKYIIQVYQLLQATSPVAAAQSLWIRSTFSDSPTTVASSADIVGSSKLISGVISTSMSLNMLSGAVVISNTSSSAKTYYYCAGQVVNNNFTGTVSFFGGNRWSENQLYAVPTM